MFERLRALKLEDWVFIVIIFAFICLGIEFITAKDLKAIVKEQKMYMDSYEKYLDEAGEALNIAQNKIEAFELMKENER